MDLDDGSTLDSVGGLGFDVVDRFLGEFGGNCMDSVGYDSDYCVSLV